MTQLPSEKNPNTYSPILELHHEQKELYLNSLTQALEGAQEICTLTDLEYRPQIQNIRQLVAFFQGNQRNEENARFSAYPSVKIATMLSGFPHFFMVNDLLIQQKLAPEYLQKLPSVDTCVEHCLQELYSEQPKMEWILEKMRKIKFYSALQEATLPAMQELSVIAYEKSQDFDAYTLQYNGYDSAKMRFLSYTILIYQKGKSAFLRNGQATDLLKESIQRYVGLSTAEMFQGLNQHTFVPISVERMVFGPFFTLLTENRDPRIDEILKREAQRQKLQLEESPQQELPQPELQPQTLNGQQTAKLQLQTWNGQKSRELQQQTLNNHEPRASELEVGQLSVGQHHTINLHRVLPYILELEQQISENEEVYLTQDVKKAMERSHKLTFRPPVKYKRHFICGSDFIWEEMQKRFTSSEYLAKFYVKNKNHQQPLHRLPHQPLNQQSDLQNSQENSQQNGDQNNEPSHLLNSQENSQQNSGPSHQQHGQPSEQQRCNEQQKYDEQQNVEKP